MVSSAMAIQDRASDPHSNTLKTRNGITFDVGGQSCAGETHFPKIRKSYTISKQRERWTEEEHKKFLEALKLYGRAWRKIEDNVGTKTAVQIRSHAQKFFSKVARESDNTSSIESIVIPPPRPKRKPMHPYPRKLASPPKKKTPLQEQPTRSTSPNASISEQENQSPASVLSAAVSEALGSADSSTPNSSPLPMSSVDAVSNACLPAEDNSQWERNASESTPDEQISERLELFPDVDAFVKEGSVEATSARSLKLFGKTVVLTDPHKSSSPSIGMSKSMLSDMGERLLQAYEQTQYPVNISLGNIDNSWNQLPWKALPAVHYMSLHSQSLAAGSSAAVPWWAICREIPTPLKRSDAEIAVSDQCYLKYGSSNRNHILIEKRACPSKCTKGFVPYKRCMSEKSITQMPGITRGEEELQTTRLCL
ncbi:hypothetical protein Nepgr_015062 [Nepenthes gracilis]|uniref:Uncharacterized protein n=1 Tax=Nepenthes gracilis TaxID=150966 RepID=A0AAD3SME0_NEPGR|nr:hypothetical protein Nepgr_015062 [Nepenthes gracilis]